MLWKCVPDHVTIWFDKRPAFLIDKASTSLSINLISEFGCARCSLIERRITVINVSLSFVWSRYCYALIRNSDVSIEIWSGLLCYLVVQSIIFFESILQKKLHSTTLSQSERRKISQSIVLIFHCHFYITERARLKIVTLLTIRVTVVNHCWQNV